MKKAWTIQDDCGDARTDIAVVVEETKEDALEALRKEMQDGDEYWTFVVIDDSIYQFAPGYGYKGDEWDCEDLRPDMWDESEADRTWDAFELPCYYMGDEYDAEEFFQYHDIVKPMLLRDFNKKFPDIVDMDEHVSNVYLDNGTILRDKDWTDDCYNSGGKYYYPVDIPISYYYDEDDDSNEPDQYEPVGYVESLY